MAVKLKVVDDAKGGGTSAHHYSSAALGSLKRLEDLSSQTTEDSVGTAGTGFTVAESGNGAHHRTTLTASTTLPAIAGGAALGVGKLAYTFPAGVIIVHGSHMDMTLTAGDGNIDADTPDVGLGTTIASGANATLSAVGAAAENLLTGQTATDCSGTATVKALGTQLVIESGDDHTVYFNAAATWSASGETACPVAGTIVLDWSFMA